jgi:hypothetical protein
MNLIVKDVRVNSTHIEKGKCGNTRRCAVALALAAHLPADTDRLKYTVSVGGKAATYTKRNVSTKKATRTVVALSSKVQEFIQRFDDAGSTHKVWSYAKSVYTKIRPIKFTTAIPVKA